MAVTLDTLTSLPRYQEAPFDAKIQSLDNLGNQMFQEGRLDEIPSVFQYKAQVELGRELSQDSVVAPMMGDIYDNLMGLRGTEEGKIRAMIGSDTYDATEERMQQQTGDLLRPAKAVEVNPGEFVFARKNPFGPGTLVQTAGEPKFYAEGFQSDEALLEQVKLDGLGPIRKNASFSKLNAEMGSYGRVNDMMRSNDWLTQSPGDQRELMRKYAWEKQTQGDTLGAQEANRVREEMDKQWLQTKNAGGFARDEEGGKDAPFLIGSYDADPMNTPEERIFSNIERGWGRFQQNQAMKKIRRESDALQSFRSTLTPEQQQVIESPEFLDAFSANMSGGGIDPGETAKLAAGTALNGVDPFSIAQYVQSYRGFKSAETEYELRNDALSLIGQNKGMQQFQQASEQLKQEGKLGELSALPGLLDQATAGQNPLERADSFVDIVAGSAIESFISQPITTAATAALFAIPVVGEGAATTAVLNLGRAGIVGTLAGLEEQSQTFTQEFEEQRALPDGSKIPVDQVLTDYEKMRQISEKAAIRGTTIGVVEGVTGYMLPGMMGGLERFFISKAAKKAATNGVGATLAYRGVELGTQLGSEAGGERLAQEATQDVDVGEVFLEAAGGFGDFASMFQRPAGFAKKASPQASVAETADALLEAAVAGVADPSIAPIEEIQRPGIYARGLIPQIEIGEADAEGNATITVYVNEPGMEAEAVPEATVAQGLEETTDLTAAIENEVGLPIEEETAPVVEGEPVVTEAPVEEAPVEEAPLPDTYPDISSISKGSKISWLTDNGEVKTGTVRSRNVKNGTFITKDGLTRFRPGQMFKGAIQPKPNTELAEIGDVLSTGDAFYRAAGDGNYVVGQRIDGEIIFDPTDIVALPKGIANDPRVKIYDKVAFEQAKAQYDARENPTAQDKFGPILATVPEKRAKGESATPVALEPVVNETTGEETLPTPKEVEAAVAQPVIPSQRTVMFSLKTHRDMATLLADGVNRLNSWFAGTRVLEETPNSMRFVKDGKEQQIFRTQDPENFDAVVAQLKEEDKFARAEKAPENWTEVPEYRELERVLNERVTKTVVRRKGKNQTVLGKKTQVENSPVLARDEISSLLTALFIQDRAIAAAASARFGLYTPNASLITISDVAKLRYGNIANNDALKLASFTPSARLIKLGHSATIIDTFHELYHDYLANIAPLVLSAQQFSQLKTLIEGQFQNQALIDFFGATGGPYAKFVTSTGRGDARVFKLAEGASFYDANGNISELAQEAFTQMMTKFHWNSGPLSNLSSQDQASLEQVNQFYQRTFSDLNSAPLEVVSDEALDLFENFFLTPPAFRTLQFDANPGTGPETNQSQRIDNEAVEKMEQLDTLGAVLRGELDVEALGVEEEKPTVKGIPPRELASFRATHGTPHEIEGKFTLNKIGTGEGAQAFGWGLYFAESEKVGKYYKTGLATRRLRQNLEAEFDLYDTADSEFNAELQKSKLFTKGEKALFQALNDNDWLGYDYAWQAVKAAIQEPESIEDAPEVLDALNNLGNLYTVEVDAEQADLLDWDKPISEQSQEVQDFARSLEFDNLSTITGEDVYRAISRNQGPTTTKAERSAADRQTSELLRSAGIPGLRFLDQSSRKKGRGTRNFVIWDEDAIKIVDVNGQGVLRELSSERPDPEYRIPRLNKRVLSGDIGQSETLQEISRTQTYLEAPNEVVMQKVQARLAAQGNLLLALRDLAKMRNLSLPQMDKLFDPENRYGGIGLASVTAYGKAILDNLDQVLVSQEKREDFDFDKDQIANMVYSVQTFLGYVNRQSGRGAQINSIGEQLTPAQQIDLLESQLVRNAASYKKFISDARNFREKYSQQVPDMSDEQLLAAMREEGIAPIFVTAMRRFASKRGTVRDLKADADAAFLKAGLNPFVKKPVRDLIESLSNAAKRYKDSPYLREMFSEWTHMVIEKERGTGLLNVLNAAAYNNLLLAPSTGMVNITGSTAKYFADLLTFYGAWVAGDFKQHKAEAIAKNLEALAYGLGQGVKNMPQGLAEMSGIALSGYRGNAVEAFSKAIGAINSTQTLMYGRAGTDANQRSIENSLKRIAGILLTDSGRRLATAPDAFMKVVADNTIIGAELYREAYDEWNLNKTSGKTKDEFIAEYIDKKLALKPLADYYTRADAVIAENLAAIEQVSVSVLPSKQDLKILRDLIAFNLRREDRDSKLDAAVIKDAQRASFGISYSNETRGAFRAIERAARSVLDLGLNTKVGKKTKDALDRTYVINAGPIKDYRLRIGTASPLGVAISPFLGNVMRQAEEMANWTGLGVLNMTATNALNVDPESTYSKMEVASAWVKTGLGLGALTATLFALGAWDDEEDQTKGLTGNVDKRFMGRNGKETIVPAFSYWYINDKGDIGFVTYKDYPQAMFFFGVPATFAQMAKKDPEGTKQGAMLLYSAQSMLDVTMSMGMYDPVLELASFFNGQGSPETKANLLKTSLGKWARTYANPLNRLQKEILGMQRGYQVLPPKGTFWETFVANTYLEGALSEAQSKELQKLVDPKGNIKEPQFLDRFGGIIREAPEGMKWMLRGGLTIQRTDYKKPIASFFPTRKDTDEQASAIFAKMNSGMFYAEHADEIEKLAASQYWPWIDAYSANEERKKEIETFYNSKTNQLRKEQNSPQFKTIKSLTQADLNKIVNKSRDLAALKVASEYYTDSPKVRQWVDAINAQEAAKGYDLPSLKVNPLLENPE
jgi:hypothetical protein